jgi:predicted ribosome quality control (RQC) complex YloA/Tae2 family protein
MSSKGRPYRTYHHEGFEILVGRGEEDNDHLTFDVAEPHDLWLHIGGEMPGSHVVVRNPEQVEVPRSVLEVAAQLAAWFSKSRGAPKAQVDYCQASQVRKPRGAPAGMVELKRWKGGRANPPPPAGAEGTE